jgi:hypothetical protein
VCDRIVPRSSTFGQDTRMKLSAWHLVFWVFVTGCASGRVVMTVEPSGSEIRAIENLSSARDLNAGKLLGKGSVSLERSDYLRKLFVLSATGYEPITLFVPELSGEEKVKITLKKEDGRLAKEVAALRSDLEAERKTNALLKEELVKQSASRHTIAAHLVKLQKWLSLTMEQDADIAVNELFRQPEALLPASAFTLRAKLRIVQGRLQDARADLQKAVSLDSSDVDAQKLLETVK